MIMSLKRFAPGIWDMPVKVDILAATSNSVKSTWRVEMAEVMSLNQEDDNPIIFHLPTYQFQSRPIKLSRALNDFGDPSEGVRMSKSGVRNVRRALPSRQKGSNIPKISSSSGVA